MVFQTYALYPHMTVRRNLSFALDLAGVDKRESPPRSTPPHASSNCKRCWSASRASSPAASGGGGDRPGDRAQPEDIPLRRDRCVNLDAALRVQMRLELARLHRNWRRP